MSKTTINPDQKSTKKKAKEESPEPAEAELVSPTEEVLSQVANHAAAEDETSVAIRDELTIGKIVNEVDDSTSGFQIPWISIAHGVGGLFEAGFSPGDIVLNKEHKLASEKEPLYVIILSSVAYLKETIKNEDWQSGIRPREYKSKEDAIAAGHTIEFTSGENGERIYPTVRPAARYLMLVRKPESVDLPSEFNIAIGDAEWGLAQYSVDKAAYDRVHKPLRTAAAFALKDAGLLRGLFRLWTQREVIRGNTIMMPKLELDSVLSEEIGTVVLNTFQTQG